MPFLNGNSTDQSTERIKIFWWKKTEKITTGRQNAAVDELVPNAQGKGEVYIHTYTFSGETEVASDLGFE